VDARVLLVPTLRVGMQAGVDGWEEVAIGARPHMHSHAERGNEKDPCIWLLPVLCDTVGLASSHRRVNKNTLNRQENCISFNRLSDWTRISQKFKAAYPRMKYNEAFFIHG
jgi:hypothetical protein